MICQCMIQAFMYGWENDNYSRQDLEIGLQYAKDLIIQGYKKEPFHHYKLCDFIRWCETKLELTPEGNK